MMKLEWDCLPVFCICLKPRPEPGLSRHPFSCLLSPDLCSWLKPFKLGALWWVINRRKYRFYTSVPLPKQTQHAIPSTVLIFSVHSELIHSGAILKSFRGNWVGYVANILSSFSISTQQTCLSA